MPLNFELPDNSVGIEPDPIEDEAARLESPIDKIWQCAMEKEAKILRRACFAPGGIEMDFGTHQNLIKHRMRLYRAKKLLKDQGNRYVNSLSISIKGRTGLEIRLADDLNKYIVEKPGEGDI